MVNDRLQPMRAAPAMKVLLMMAGVLGTAAGTVRAAQAPPATALPAGKAAIAAPARAPGRNSGTVSAGSPRPSAIKPAVPGKSRHKRSPVRVSGKGPKTAGARAGTTGSAPTPKERILTAAAGRRDPFKPWEPPGAGVSVTGGPSPSTLPPGNRGLLIGHLRVVGIVREESANKMIAVVTNYTKRAYFLREDDAVYNGRVSRISPEAVYFKENSLDSNGRVITHDVVVRIGSAAGEGR